LAESHLRSLREYEKLHEKFLSSPNKRDVLFKKVYAIESYVLYASGDYVVMTTITHNRTTKGIGEIC
jgi:hypothetical protein